MHSLIQKILAGDNQAVVTFYHDCSPRIARFLRKKLPREEDVQEVLQDVFLEALDSLSLFSGKSLLSTWLYGIAKHKVVDYYRKRKIKSFVFSQLPFLQIFAEEIHQPEFQFEKNKVRDKIELTFQQLSTKYREILKKHYEDNIPIKHIAEEMNLSFKATESLLYRARQDFIKKYEKE